MAIIPAPAVPEYDPYRTFTQDNFLNEQTDAILPREVLTKQEGEGKIRVQARSPGTRI